MKFNGTDFDPSKPDGENPSLNLAVSADGSPNPDHRYQLPARCGMAVRVNAGQILTIENTHGTQVCDFWAFLADDLQEYLSMAHLHTSLKSIFPQQGDALVSNRRRALMTIVKDTSPGIHDTVISACDIYRYHDLGCDDYHDNCTDNLRMALLAIGQRAPRIPDPFNIWMNIPIASDGTADFLPTVSRPGDVIALKAELDCIAVMSTCPMDLSPINGEDGVPKEIHFWVD